MATEWNKEGQGCRRDAGREISRPVRGGLAEETLSKGCEELALGDELPKRREQPGKGFDGSGLGLRKGSKEPGADLCQRGRWGWTMVASGATGKTGDFTRKETAGNGKLC